LATEHADLAHGRSEHHSIHDSELLRDELFKFNSLTGRYLLIKIVNPHIQKCIIADVSFHFPIRTLCCFHQQCRAPCRQFKTLWFGIAMAQVPALAIVVVLNPRHQANAPVLY